MDDLDEIVDEYWERTKMLGVDFLFLLSVGISLFILGFYFATKGDTLPLVILGLVGIFYLVIAFMVRNLNLLELMNGESSNTIKLWSSGKEVVAARRKVLLNMLNHKKVSPEGIIEAAMWKEEVRITFPPLTNDAGSKNIKLFMFERTAKPRIITLLVSLFALVTIVLINAIERSDLLAAVEGIYNFSTTLVDVGIITFVIIVAVIVTVIQYWSLFRFSFLSLFPTRHAKERYLIQGCLRLQKISRDLQRSCNSPKC